MAMNKFQEKQYEAEILSELYDLVQRRKRDAESDYDVIQVLDEQETSWQTGELLWEDEEKTIPRMKKEYGYITKLEEELTEEDRMRIRVCSRLMNALEKML